MTALLSPGGWTNPAPSPNTGFIAIAANGHSLGLKSDGSIVSWGTAYPVPSPNTGFVAIAAGYRHSLGLKSDGSIVAWGYNGNLQCNVPSPNSSYVAIASGDYHSIGIRAVAEDLNRNGFVNFIDVAIIANKWMMNCSSPDWCGGSDLDKNGVVDSNDLQRVARRWLWE